MLARSALVTPPHALAYDVVRARLVPRAPETVWPARKSQRFLALSLRPKVGKELRQRRAGLKVKLAARHRALPVAKLQDYDSTGSWGELPETRF